MVTAWLARKYCPAANSTLFPTSDTLSIAYRGFTMTDKGIRQRIRRLLRILRLEGVQVDVEEGIVYLEGVAESAAHKQLLENLVRHLDGVRAVVNCLALEHVVHWPRWRGKRRGRLVAGRECSYPAASAPPA
jgi:hypothetical protein